MYSSERLFKKSEHISCRIGNAHLAKQRYFEPFLSVSHAVVAMDGAGVSWDVSVSLVQLAAFCSDALLGREDTEGGIEGIIGEETPEDGDVSVGVGDKTEGEGETEETEMEETEDVCTSAAIIRLITSSTHSKTIGQEEVKS